MCAILDANVAHKVFGKDRPEAGEKFFEWLHSGSGSLVVGGKLLRELAGSGNVRDWLSEATKAGWIRRVCDQKIDEKMKRLMNEGSCKSNDQHVIALAQIGGARLLYSDDGTLHKDFKNPDLIDDPRGVVYSTAKTGSFTRAQQKMLDRKDLCRT